MSAEREDKVYMAKIAEQAERYDEMVKYMKEVVELNEGLSAEERNLLSVAYKNVIGARRASGRIVSSIEQNEESKGHDALVTKIKAYRSKIENELYQVCNDILKLLKEHLIPSADTPEAKVFYYKMEGDYHRYVSEYATDTASEESAHAAHEAYEQASKIAQTELSPTNPISLGLALNYSVFYYEILNKPEEACKLARTSFDHAIAELDNLSEGLYRDSTLIMQLLRDNLSLWTSDPEEVDKPENA